MAASVMPEPGLLHRDSELASDCDLLRLKSPRLLRNSTSRIDAVMGVSAGRWVGQKVQYIFEFYTI